MKALSKTKRRFFFIFFTIIFIVSLPLVIMHARGYRLSFSDVLTFGRTGGIYVSTGQSGMEIYLGDELVKKTGIFQKNFLIQNLKPGSYFIRVSKEGLQSWSKILPVYPETVTEAYPFSLPEEIVLEPIYKFLDENRNPTSTAPKISSLLRTNPTYTSTLDLFNATSTYLAGTSTATTTSRSNSSKKPDINIMGGNPVATWSGKVSDIPIYFCDDVSCEEEIVIDVGKKVLSVDFFPGRDDLLVVASDDGIYAVEIDGRSKQNIQTIYEGKNLNFAIKDGIIYIKEGDSIYSVVF